MTEPQATPLTGSRIRERRLAQGLAQGALAQAIGISPSYLNLIEHNHRKIGGALLLALARELQVEPAVLTEGAGARLADLMQAARNSDSAPRPETDRLDELGARFPGWTGLIAAQEQRCRDLEAQIDALRDRMAHEADLSEAMHDLLSSVAAIRSTADILVREADIAPEWQGRFHRNIHEEAERLSDRATGLLDRFELPDRRSTDAKGHAVEAVEAMFDLAEHHFPSIEQGGVAAIDRVIDKAVGLDVPAARDMALAWLTRYAEDAARLPLARLDDAIGPGPVRPEALWGLAGGDVALVLRRLAHLPPRPDEAPFGIAIIDASGALLFRRRVPGFTFPRFGPSFPTWPIYRAFARPGQPETALVDYQGRGRLRVWSVAQLAPATGLALSGALHATMLVQAVPDSTEDHAIPLVAVGPDGPECQATPYLSRS